jgi:hypothetical protein
MPLLTTIDAQLKTAANFAILGSSTVTNSGSTVISGGNLGLYPGTSLVGFPPGVVIPPAVIDLTNQIANQAELDAMSAYNFYQSLPPGALISELAGKTLFAGTYTAPSSLDLSVGGTVFLNAQGNPNAQFIFQVPSSLTINTGATIVLLNGALAQNVIFLVGSSVTIGTSAVVVGDFIALSSVSLGTGASLTGRAIGLTGAVTLLGNNIFMPTPILVPIAVTPFPVTFSSTGALLILSGLCFPDCTGAIIRAWGLATLTPGGYPTGGIPFGLVNFLDVRTVDFNAFLKCDVYGEEPLNTTTSGITYHYSPTNDALQIFFNGVEFANNQTVPLGILADVLLFECWVDRTSTRDVVPFAI